jgi:hypothetical protein
LAEPIKTDRLDIERTSDLIGTACGHLKKLQGGVPAFFDRILGSRGCFTVVRISIKKPDSGSSRHCWIWSFENVRPPMETKISPRRAVDSEKPQSETAVDILCRLTAHDLEHRIVTNAKSFKKKSWLSHEIWRLSAFKCLKKQAEFRGIDRSTTVAVSRGAFALVSKHLSASR